MLSILTPTNFHGSSSLQSDALFLLLVTYSCRTGSKGMKIAVFGGSGLVGKQLVSVLHERGHEVVAASPSLGGVNTVTGEGLAAALEGAEVVVDVTNAPCWDDGEDLEFFETSSRNLLSAEATAGVKHHIVLSVVGADRVTDFGYFRAKVAQENVVLSNRNIPYTILRATQFFESMGVFGPAADGLTIRVPPAYMQPIASQDVATALADVAVSEPTNGTVDIAGPDRATLEDLTRRWLSATKNPCKVVTDVNARYVGAALAEMALVPAGDPARMGTARFDDWLCDEYQNW
jgi:uncharacterized protein YbjT (DUF2867 family)